MITKVLSLLTAVESGATISLLNGGGDERVAEVLYSAKKTLTEAQQFVDLPAQLMGVELPEE